MATNEIFRNGKHLALPVPAGTPAGTPIQIGGANGLTGVTDTVPADSVNGVFGGGNIDGYASVNLEGAFNLTVNGAVTAVGAPVYIDGSNNLQTAATGNSLFGYALGTKSASAATIPVLLHRN